MMGKRVAVGMSGGVDSSVAALILKESGYEVFGVIMEVYDGSCGEGGSKHACYGPGEFEDVADALKVADILDIPLQKIDLRKEYKREVLDYFVDGYSSGMTPNPCVRCNSSLKFGEILKSLNRMGKSFDYYATGHYARVVRMGDGKSILKKGLDSSKDQSYYLYHLDQALLQNLILPLGELTKSEVRKLALKASLPVADKDESQDFIEGGYNQLFNGNEKPGEIVDCDGEVLGTHRGIEFYTVGQRRGIGLSGVKPLYVVGKDPLNNRLMVGESEALLSRRLRAKDLKWIVGEPDEDRVLDIKIRYGGKPAKGRFFKRERGAGEVVFNEPVKAVAPGQAVVFYEGEYLLGGGIIEKEN